jgi:Fe-S cluster biosynthesis and repair protein YggX
MENISFNQWQAHIRRQRALHERAIKISQAREVRLLKQRLDGYLTGKEAVKS